MRLLLQLIDLSLLGMLSPVHMGKVAKPFPREYRLTFSIFLVRLKEERSGTGTRGGWMGMMILFKC